MQYKKLIGIAAALTTALTFAFAPVTVSACNNGHHAKCHCKAGAHKCSGHHCGCKSKKQTNAQTQGH